MLKKPSNSRIGEWSKEVCAMCFEPLTKENREYLPIDGGSVVGPLCIECEELFYVEEEKK